MKTLCPRPRLGVRQAALLVCLFGLAASVPGAVIHVTTNGVDSASGASWNEAKRTVAGALQTAARGTDIWLARGMYAEHIRMKPGVRLLGGFAGTETQLEQRNWHTNQSVLWGVTNQAVVTITNAGPDTVLDGLVIGGGNGIHGGGVAMVGSGSILANNTIRNNLTDGAGAGVSIWGFHLVSSVEAYHPILTNNVIVNNQAILDEGDGAGIAVVGSSPLIARNVIAHNTATRNGGGIACWRHSLPQILNNLIEANSASYDELTVSLGGGGIFASATDLDGRPIAFAVSAPRIVNNVIAVNGGRHGGGVTVVDSLLGAATLANNTIVANNGAGVFWANTWPTNHNNLVALNTHGFERGLVGTSDADLRFNNVYGNGVPGTAANYLGTADRTGHEGNFSEDPRFANTAIGNYHLQPGSPCMEAGSTALAELRWPDFDGEPRLQGAAVDVGADEADGTQWEATTPVVRVSAGGDDTDGKTWATAKRTVAAGIALASVTGGEVWVGQGVYRERLVPPVFVHLYGGFAGSETARAERHPWAHRTTLDGEGQPTIVYYRNNGYRASTLDGFTLQNGGWHTGGDVFHPELTNRFGGRGGGIYCRVSGPEIVSNTIRSNSLGSPYNVAESYGGGLYCYLGHALVRSNLFYENEVLTRMDGNGGGIFCLESSATIEFNTLRANRALNGAAIQGELSELTVRGNTIESNQLYHASAPVYMGSINGALNFWASPSLLVEANQIRGNVADFGAGIFVDSCPSAIVRNNLIVDNLAFDYSGFGQGGMGGGIYWFANLNSTGTALIAHNTLVGNQAPATFMGSMGGGIALTLVSNTVTLANNILADNTSGIWRDWRTPVQPIVRNNCLLNPTNCVHFEPDRSNYLTDPRLVDLAGRDLHLRPDSPCVDSAATDFATATDQEFTPRPLDGRNDGAAEPDIGAFEFVHPLADTDADASLDATEIVAGTNPTDPTSRLALAIRATPDAAGLRLEWASVVGRTYTLQHRTTPTGAANWEDASAPVAGTGEVKTIELPIGPAERFYRLGVQRD